MVASASREVEILLKYKLDKASLDEIRKSGKEAVTIQDTIRRAAEQGAAGAAKAHKKAVDEIDKDLMKWGSSEARRIDKAERERLRYWANESRRLDKSEREREKYWANESRRIDRNLKEQERSVAAAATAQQRHEAAIKGSLSASVQLAKGLAQMGLVGEESTKKILDGLIKIESAANVAKGALQLRSSLRGVDAASGGGAATGGGSALRGASSLIGGLSTAAVAALSFAGVVVTAVAILDKLNKEELQNVKDNQQQRRDREGRMIDATSADIAAMQSRAAIRRGGQDDLDLLSSGKALNAARSIGDRDRFSALDDSVAVNAARLARERGRLAAAVDERQLNRRIVPAGAERAALQAANAGEQARSISEIVKLEQERLKLIREGAKTAAESAKQQLDAAKQTLDSVRQRLAMEQAALQTAEEKFAALDPVKQRQAVEAARKAKRGGALTDAERKVLGESGLGEADDSVGEGVRNDARRRVTAAGADDFFRERRDRISRIQDTANDLQQDVIDGEKLAKAMKEGAEKQANALVEELAKLIAQRDERLLFALKEANESQKLNDQVKQSAVPKS